MTGIKRLGFPGDLGDAVSAMNVGRERIAKEGFQRICRTGRATRPWFGTCRGPAFLAFGIWALALLSREGAAVWPMLQRPDREK